MHRRADAPLLSVRRRSGRITLLLLGIILPQLLLYWPSLTGRKILLPLDILAEPNVYLPRDAAPDVSARNVILSDLVFALEPFRRFAVDEVRAGRMPLWNPNIYCGAPFLANNQSAVLSPYRILDYLTGSPIALAWTQLIQSIVAGCGAYLFFRRALGTSFVPAIIGAWCYPLTGALVFWTGFTNASVITFLPWTMFFVDRTVRRPTSLAPAGLAIATGFALVAGHSATAAHMLIAAGLFGLFRLLQRARPYSTTPLLHYSTTVLSLSLAFTTGILLAAPQLLPTLEYLRTSYRFATRLSGNDPTPVLGVTAIAQTILPYSYGTDERTSLQFFPHNIPESAASAYAGLILVLTFAPLAFAIRRRRTTALFFVLLAFFAAIAILGIPILSKPFLLFPLSALRNNRFVFVTSFSLLTLAVLGLDSLSPYAGRGLRRGGSREAQPRLTFWISGLLLILTAAWCFYRFLTPFDRLGFVLADATTRLAAGETLAPPFNSPDAIEHLRLSFARIYFSGFFFSIVGLVLLLMFLPRAQTPPAPRPRHRLLWIAGALALCELLFTAWNRIPQTDPSLYYPPLRFAEFLQSAPPGRTLPLNCLPANLPMAIGLRDIRGYDATDPQRIIELLNLARTGDPGATARYAHVQYYLPRFPSPILDMLNVRYLVGPMTRQPPAPPIYADSAYWIVANPLALPRAYIPKEASIVNDRAERLRLLSAPIFSPRDIAHVESAGSLPPPPYQGEVRIDTDEPTHLTLTATMRTAGLVVISDLYDPGWSATVNKTDAPILPTNHALRGIVLPEGQSHIELHYHPKSFTWGLRLAGLGAILLIAHATFHLARRRRRRVIVNTETPHG